MVEGEEQTEPAAHSALVVVPAGQYWPLAQAAVLVVVEQYQPAAHRLLVVEHAGQ
jgi:hypothetical protein